MAIKARYTSKTGAYLNGVPARDLGDEEYEALDTEQKKAVRASGAYRMAESEQPKSEARERAAQPGGGE